MCYNTNIRNVKRNVKKEIMKWIDVNDELPPVDETVIVWSAAYKDCYGRYDYDMIFDIEEVGAVGDVTHWMYRPKSPFKPIIKID